MKEYSYGIIPVLKEDDKCKILLILQRNGYWGFPKGHAEKNESEIEAAKRETCEEAGICECEILQDVYFDENYVFNIHGNVVHKTVRYFIGFVNKAEVKIQVSEIKRYRWCSFNDARRFIKFKNMINLLDKVEKLLKEASK